MNRRTYAIALVIVLLAVVTMHRPREVAAAQAEDAIGFCGPTDAATPSPVADAHGSHSVEAPFDLVFIDQMIDHHAGAIAMANVALERATDSQVRRLALRIAESQAGEIQLLRAWRDIWFPGAGPTEAPSDHGGHSSVEMGDAAAIATLCTAGDDFDRMFLEMMIVHHQAAVSMAEDAIVHSEHPELIDFAKVVIAAQSDEIAMMSRWLESMNATPAAMS